MNNKSRRKKKSSRRSLSKKFFGGTRDAYGKKRRKFGWLRELILLLVVIAVGGGTIFWLSSLQKKAAENISADTLFQEEAFDPVRDYKAIRDNGTISQLSSLLLTLKSKKMDLEYFPIQLENDRKIIEIAEAVMAHPDCDDKNFDAATIAKLDASWHSYNLSQRNSLNDPFIAEKFFSVANQLVDHEKPEIAKQAQLLKAHGIVIQTVRKQFLGSEQAVLDSISKLLQNYLDDPVVTESVKKMFTEYRAYDSESAVRLAGQLAPIIEPGSSESGKKLFRFMKDIIALYDSGIGNTKAIYSIIVDDKNFMQRLTSLNEDPDTGPTVVVQLDNAIEYFERERKYALAKNLSELMLQKAPLRTISESRDLAESYARNAIKRNSLLGQPWSFQGEDSDGKPITEDRYLDRVIMIVYYEIGDPENTKLFGSMAALYQYLFGKDFDFICIGVDTRRFPESGVVVPSQFISVETTFDSPHAFLEQCPTKRLPYAILIDKKGNVDSINVTLSTVKTRIEYLLSNN